MKKLAILFLFVAITVGSIGSVALCEEDTLTIGFCNYSDSAQFFMTVRESMERVCAEKGYNLLYAVSEGDPSKMRTAWETFATQGADIIIDASILEDSGSTLSRVFKEQYGLDVISVDNVYDNAYFFGVNNQGVGETAGYYLADEINETWGGQVDCMLQFYLESNGPTVRLRNSGIYDGLIEKGIELSEEDVTRINASGTAQSGTDPSVMKVWSRTI